MSVDPSTVDRLTRADGLQGIPRLKRRKTIGSDGAETPRPVGNVLVIAGVVAGHPWRMPTRRSPRPGLQMCRSPVAPLVVKRPGGGESRTPACAELSDRALAEHVDRVRQRRAWFGYPRAAAVETRDGGDEPAGLTSPMTPVRVNAPPVLM